MDTKWKNSRKKRINITIITLVILAVVNVCLCPLVYRLIIQEQGIQPLESIKEEQLNEEAIEWLYQGCYVLYYEHMQSMGKANSSITDFYFPYLEEELGTWNEENVKEDIEFRLEYCRSHFEKYRREYDYYVMKDGNSESNTSAALGELLEYDVSEERFIELVNEYEYCLAILFDNNGNMEVRIIKISDVHQDIILKCLQRSDRNLRLQELMKDVYDTNTYPPQKITDFSIIYGIPYGVSQEFQFTCDVYENDEYRIVLNHSYTQLFYLCNIFVLIALVIIMTSSKIWKSEITFVRRGREYFFELAVFLGGSMLLAYNSLYGQFVAEIGTLVFVKNFYNNVEWIQFFAAFLGMLMILGCDYLTLLYIRPVFTLGLVDYIREYSLLYRMWKGIKGLCVRGMESLKQVDLSEKASKTIFKFVAVNFVILGIMMCMWFMGLFGLIIYSVVLFFLIRKYYAKVVEDYKKALNMTKRIANGEFTQEVEEDFGIFNSLKAELCRIEEGFQKAVEQETKSQRMKTELITNVSHDLKTPLTAITTYVELLKKEDITEEERREYIDTLSRKSFRLKVLIEDLFEVSKASSQNIVLQYIDVDVVNLMKQVYIEHEEKLSNMGLDIRWNVPNEKVVLSLDNQKTYRIFENLFVNIQKYAMPNSRVYIDILQVENQVQIIMKNISATELNVRSEELTERFVRGDQSRNTEGSGLGLAIVKSFVEAQKGRFEITVDGDLFKATIIFTQQETTAAL
ncbi:MAG: sensor histidine kinase [Lachnospiraceae bacterium]|nr:sensor histidine kinase [Lachnospiraceae bacterium]